MIEIIKREHSIKLMRDISHIALNKDVYKELGYPIFSDYNHTWYLLYIKDDLIGFCSSISKKNHISFSHDYILKEFRGKGYYNCLFKYRLLDTKKQIIKSVATQKSINTFKRFGFNITKKTKNYTFVQKK